MSERAASGRFDDRAALRGDDRFRPSFSHGGGSESAALALFCSKFAEYVRRNDRARRFLYTIGKTADGMPDYRDVIRHPMNLSKLIANLDSRKYANAEEFKNDFDLIWANEIVYHGHDSDIGLTAAAFKEDFTSIWKSNIRFAGTGEGRSMLSDILRAKRLCEDTMRLPLAKSLKFPRHPRDPFRTSRRQRPASIKQARVEPPPEPSKEVMTLRERRDLAVTINNLPPELLGGILRAVAKVRGLTEEDLRTHEYTIPITEFSTEMLHELRMRVAKAEDEEWLVKSMASSGAEPMSAEQEKKCLTDEKNRIEALLKEEELGGNNMSENEAGTDTSQEGTSDESSDSSE